MLRRAVSVVSGFGFVYTLVQLILKSMHSSICTTQGCLLVAKSVRYSDSLIILAGVVTFLVIFLLSLSKSRQLDSLIDYILTLALSAEGIFVGYQLFRIKHLCLFCLSVFAIFVIIALLRLLQARYRVLVGFASFSVVLSLCYLLKPVTTPMLAAKPLVLVYKPSCSHCERVIEEARRKHVNIYTVNADTCLPFLKSLNINEVPVLIVNRKGEKRIIIGEDNILNYMFSHRNSSGTQVYMPLFDKKEGGGFCTLNGKCD